MTQDSGGPSAENRRHPASTVAAAGVADSVDAAVHATQLPARNPVLDGSPTHPQDHELAATDNAMLCLCEVPDPLIKRTRRMFSMPDMGNVRRVVHMPILACRNARVMRCGSQKCNAKEAPARRYRLWL